MNYIIEWEIGEERRYTFDGFYVTPNVKEAKVMTLDKCLNVIKGVYEEVKSKGLAPLATFRVVKV